jgi:8-oxo-dGTP pyrophosphatase MutT (NUDIX family)
MSGYIMDLRKVIGSLPLIMAAAAVIVVNADGRILLQHRSDNDCWGLPGGSMELGESFEETASREVLEETGLVVGKLKLLYVHSGREAFYRYPNGHQVYVAGSVYTTTEFTGDLKVDKDESLEVAWFLRTDVPPNINPLDRPVIEFFIEHTA